MALVLSTTTCWEWNLSPHHTCGLILLDTPQKLETPPTMTRQALVSLQGIVSRTKDTEVKERTSTWMTFYLVPN